ncbi:MAG: endonuclease V [Candidatus Woesearchaeota archaeon]
MLNLESLKEVQRKIAKEVSLKDSVDISQIKTVAGFDVAFSEKSAFCTGVILKFPGFEIVEKKEIKTKIPMKYFPGFLAFREGPPIIEVLREFENEFDAAFVKGHGIAHPLKAGIACYVGINISKPTIGVAKELLSGEIRNDKIYMDGELRGFKIVTKQGSRPLYISPGHLISQKGTLELVKKCLVENHKMPEPIFQAHKLNREFRIENLK